MEELKRVLGDQRETLESLENYRLIERDLPFDVSQYLSRPNVLAVLGVRRSGKSTLAYLLVRGRRFAYVDFSDDRLSGLSDFDSLTRALYELYGDFEFLVLDEPQYAKGWELFVNRMRKEKRVIVTGSSSSLLSGELSTALTGRHVDLVLFPFSFREYLRFKGVEPRFDTTKSLSAVKRALEDYLKEGGFPEALTLGKRVIPSVFHDVITRDVIERHRVKEAAKFRNFAVSVTKYYSTEVSVRKLSNLFGTSTATVEEWLSYLQESYLLYFVRRFSRSPKQLNGQRKVYVVDPGVVNYVAGFSYGGLMEDVVAVHLLRRNQLEGVYYLKGEDYEVDFVDAKGERLIQVSYVSSEDEVGRNELKGLVKGSGATGFRELVLVTWDLEGEIEAEGRKIKAVPLWKFLLID